jgi:hypothetical protein
VDAFIAATLDNARNSVQQPGGHRRAAEHCARRLHSACGVSRKNAE